MLIILPAALAILVGAGAIAWRANQGQLSSAFNSQTYAARKAAEAGISRLISDWNLPNNRMLLASGSPASTWQPSTEALRNPCTATGATLSTAQAIGGADLASYRTGDWISIDGSRRYRLRRVTFRNWVRNGVGSLQKTSYTQPAFNTGSIPDTGNYPDMSTNTSTSAVPRPISLGDPDDRDKTDRRANTFGYLEVEVEGQEVRGNTILASSRVVKEFQVVPKCCGRSFGKTIPSPNALEPEYYGNDLRRCSVNSLGEEVDTLQLSPTGLGVIFGLNGGGIQKASSNSWTLRVAGTDPPNVKKPPVICTTTAKYCDGPDQDSLPDNSQVSINDKDNIDMPLVATNIKIPNPPLIPTSGFTQGPISASNSSSSVNGGKELSAQNITGATTLPQDGVNPPSSNGGNGKGGGGKGGSTPQSYCGYLNGAYHCRISSISLSSSAKIQVDTTSAPVYLYLQENSSSADIKITGTAGIEHTGDPDKFRILGKSRNGNPTSQTFDFGGGSGNTKVFIWAPVADLTLGGNSSYTAITWVNNLGFSGNAEVKTPGGATDQPCPQIPSDSDVYCNLLNSINPGLPINPFDWIARSETFSRVVNGNR